MLRVNLYSFMVCFYWPLIVCGQERCIFGAKSDCYFPCHCKTPESALGLEGACNRTNGHCYKRDCLSYYDMVTVGGLPTCQPDNRFLNRFQAFSFGVYLVHPTTRQRLTGDLSSIIIGASESRLTNDCSFFLDSSTIMGINDTLMWEFDFRRLMSFRRYLKFITYRTRQTLTTPVQINFEFKTERNKSGTTWPAACSVSSSYDRSVICSYSLSSRVLAKHVFFKADIYPLQCFVFKSGYFHSGFGYAADMNCSRCLQTDADPCGNGYWCETCAAGWKPPDCRDPCDPGYHGINCLETYNWQGTLHAVELGNDNVTIEISCDTVVPFTYRSNFVFRFEQVSPYSSSLSIPYTTQRFNVSLKAEIGSMLQIKITMILVFGDSIVFGESSELLTIPVTARQNNVCPTAVPGTFTASGAIDNDDEDKDKSNQSVVTILLPVVLVLCIVITGGVLVLYISLRRAKAADLSSIQTTQNEATAPNLGVRLSALQLEEVAAVTTGGEYVEARARDSLLY